MLKFTKLFLLFMICYHILVTVLCYGVFGGHYQEMFSLLRDGIWIGFMLFAVVRYRQHLKGFLTTWRYPLISFCVLLIFGIGISRLIGKSRYDIFVGIKYGLWYLWILFSAGFVGYNLALGKQEVRMETFLRFFIWACIVIVVLGFVRQGAKIFFPDLFTWMGYGPLNDFSFGVKPPLYYLTGYEGTLRRQGIFAGPNNYGYFLVVLLAVIIHFVQGRRNAVRGSRYGMQKLLLAGISVLRILAIVMTLSRSALVGTMVVVIFLFRSRIKKHRKLSLGILILCLLGLVGLSVLKDTSTLAHIAKKFSSLSYVINQPFGYGLGSSGPAIHHGAGILPENYFIQLMIDIGTVGFLIWVFCVSQVGALVRAIKKQWISGTRTAGRDPYAGIIYATRKGLTIGWIALLVMGMFLHVFEDSMVNYIFFILRGITTGYLSFGLKAGSLGMWDFWRKR